MRHAIVGSLLLVAIPPLLPMASTAMPDVLALAVGLIGMERLAAWRDDQKWHQGAAAALSLGLAGIARARLVLLLPLGAFFLADSLKPREVVVQLRHSLRLWTPIVAGGFLLLLIIYATRESGLLLNPPSVVSGADNIRLNLRSYLQYLCLPLPLAVCCFLRCSAPTLLLICSQLRGEIGIGRNSSFCCGFWCHYQSSITLTFRSSTFSPPCPRLSYCASG